jgi:hypothetical protein
MDEGGGGGKCYRYLVKDLSIITSLVTIHFSNKIIPVCIICLSLQSASWQVYNDQTGMISLLMINELRKTSLIQIKQWAFENYLTVIYAHHGLVIRKIIEIIPVLRCIKQYSALGFHDPH